LSFSQSSSPNFSNQEVSERLLDEREFYSLEENDRQVILAKAEGNPITPPTNRGPSNFPTPPSGGRPVYVPEYRIAPKIVDPGLGAGANPAGAGYGGENPEFDDQCPVPKNQLSQESKTFDYDSRSNTQQNKDKKRKKKKSSQEVSEQKVIEAYQNFISEMKNKGYDINISEDKFIELCKNPQTGKFDKKSIFEVEGGLQGEVEGLYSNLRRTRNTKVDLDFEATSVKTGKTIFVDHKRMIDFGSLPDIGIDTSSFPSHESVAFNMGKDSVAQKERFVGLDKGPKSRSDVLHLYNFQNIQNKAEIPFLVQAVLNGAEQAGYTNGINFINDK
jgi:hypothetical protein